MTNNPADTLKEAKMREIIGEAIGQASMCWKPYPTGVFDSTRASEIVDGAIGLLRAPSEKPTGDRVAALEVDYDDATSAITRGVACAFKAEGNDPSYRDIARGVYAGLLEAGYKITHPAPVTEEKEKSE